MRDKIVKFMNSTWFMCLLLILGGCCIGDFITFLGVFFLLWAYGIDNNHKKGN